MQKYVDLAMRAHYDVAADQVVLHPVKDKHPDLMGMRVNLKRGTASDDKLRLHMHAAGVITNEQVPSGFSLDSWANLPGISRADVQLLKLLLKNGEPIVFAAAKNASGYRLRSACLSWAQQELGKEVRLAFAGTPTELDAYIATSESVTSARLVPLIDTNGFLDLDRSDMPSVAHTYQVEGAADMTQAAWCARELLPGQALIGLPTRSITTSGPERVLSADGQFHAGFKAQLSGYFTGSIGAIVYLARSADGWVLSVDLDFPPTDRNRRVAEDEVAW